MKSYRNAIAVLVLTFVLSTFANAEGVLWTDKTPPPPPTNGVLWTESADPVSEEDTLTEIALTLLQTLIPLL